jgi:hypothetical protein
MTALAQQLQQTTAERSKVSAQLSEALEAKAAAEKELNVVSVSRD